MVRDKISLVVGIAMLLALVSAAQPDGPREGSPPPTMVMPVPPQPPGGPGPMFQMALDTRPGPGAPGGPGPMPMMRMKELADQLRARAREAQELSDRLRRQADELDQMAMRPMGPRPGPQPTEQVKRELDEIKEGIARAEREGRPQEAQELRRRAEQLMGQFRPLSPDERQAMIKRQLERLRDESQKAKEQGREEDAKRLWQEADRMEQSLRGQAPQPPRPRGDERQETKRKIQDLRNEAQRAKDQGRMEDSNRLWKEAERLEQQLREQGPREKGEFGRPMAPEVQDILRAAEQAEREGRMEDARRQREKAESVARQLQEQKGKQVFGQPGPGDQERQDIKRKIGELRKEADRLEQQLREGPRDDARPMKKEPKGPGPESSDRSFKDEIMRSLGGLKMEIGRLWQAVNEMRNRPKEGKPT